MAIVWILSGILTAAGAFTDDPSELGYKARTDTRADVMAKSSYLFIPYPCKVNQNTKNSWNTFTKLREPNYTLLKGILAGIILNPKGSLAVQFGTPTVSAGVVGAMMAAIITSMLDSCGDYMAYARTMGYPLPPKHAVNRGIAVEGLATVLSGWFQTLLGSTSSHNMPYTKNNMETKHLNWVFFSIERFFSSFLTASMGTCHGTSSYLKAVGVLIMSGVRWERNLWGQKHHFVCKQLPQRRNSIALRLAAGSWCSWPESF